MTAQENATTVAAPTLPHSDSGSFSEKDLKDSISDEKKVDVESHSVLDDDVGSEIIVKDEDVALEVSPFAFWDVHRPLITDMAAIRLSRPKTILPCLPGPSVRYSWVSVFPRSLRCSRRSTLSSLRYVIRRLLSATGEF